MHRSMSFLASLVYVWWWRVSPTVRLCHWHCKEYIQKKTVFLTHKACIWRSFHLFYASMESWLTSHGKHCTASLVAEIECKYITSIQEAIDTYRQIGRAHFGISFYTVLYYYEFQGMSEMTTSISTWARYAKWFHGWLLLVGIRIWSPSQHMFLTWKIWKTFIQTVIVTFKIVTS